MWFEFFVFGGVWFWGLAALEIVLLFICIANELFGKAAFSIGIFALLLCFFGSKGTISSAVAYIKNNPGDVLRWAAVYIVIGVLWAIVKMLLSTNKVKHQILKIKEKYVVYLSEFEAGKTKTPRSTEVGWNSRETESTPKSWDAYLHSSLGYKSTEKLEFSTYRDKVTYWGLYWPISFLWTLLSGLVVDVARWIYDNILVGVFRYIHSKTIGEALKFESPVTSVPPTPPKSE